MTTFRDKVPAWIASHDWDMLVAQAWDLELLALPDLMWHLRTLGSLVVELRNLSQSADPPARHQVHDEVDWPPLNQALSMRDTRWITAVSPNRYTALKAMHLWLKCQLEALARVEATLPAQVQQAWSALERAWAQPVLAQAQAQLDGRE